MYMLYLIYCDYISLAESNKFDNIYCKIRNIFFDTILVKKKDTF